MTGTVIGVDVGGTFTDLISADPETGQVAVSKVPTTLDNQAFGVIEAMQGVGVDLSDVVAINHGTTTTTNALLERKIARVGLVTTRGFRDVLELGRRTRPQPYGLKGRFKPLISREYRMEVPERINADGEVVVPLDEAALRDKIRTLVEMGAESLVIHFLHSYKNPDHEKRALEIAREMWPNRFVTAGHEILSEYREYERGTTAAINGAIRPVLDRYINRLQEELTRGGFAHDLLVMQGNGGSVSSRIVAESAVNTVMSGPASGVMAAAATCREAGIDKVITYDMGGTSSDVGMVQGGVPQVTAELDLEYGMPIHVPMVDVHTIGAGGGSIAFVNEAGLLQVGPESAGATPGPICYGRGGTQPTITDANLVLGRLDAEKLLAVDHPVSLEDVRRAFEREIGHHFGMTAEEVATAILQVANNRMAGAIRMVSLSRGHDPRDFALFAFGGAGPLHGGALARELGIPRVVIPARPGITNALGCVVSDLRHDFVNTVNTPLAAVKIEQVREIIRQQINDGKAMIERDGVATRELVYLFSADMQFQGQSHMLSVEISGPDVTREELQRRFDEVYWKRFAVELPEIKAVLVNLHTAVIGKRDSVDLKTLAGTAQADRLEAAQRTTRRVMFAGDWFETPVFWREKLPQSLSLTGPAILEQLDTTIVIEPGDRVTADPVGNLIVEVHDERA
ncbi:hydantoinase/oxoprolinase family protein [Sneathiella chinensis]|uniref:Hydantoinase n=1 Tax=Sneathiella chinensis TaxID=349750 RepID=A0ABQ5U4P0_9PROT|nr:hydantoinase/oxoprolinase family protein [Sneathiella chinensis]GLQ06635.1 hydantoinase [Sneathiella chinensis]